MTQAEPSKRPKAELLLDRKVFLAVKKNIKLELFHKYRYSFFEMDRIRDYILVKDTEDDENMLTWFIFYTKSIIFYFNLISSKRIKRFFRSDEETRRKLKYFDQHLGNYIHIINSIDIFDDGLFSYIVYPSYQDVNIIFYF